MVVYTLEKEVALHSSILAWEIPCTEDPGGLQSLGSQTVRHALLSNWALCIYVSATFSVHFTLSFPCPQVCSLPARLHYFPADRFIGTIFLDSICMYYRLLWWISSKESTYQTEDAGLIPGRERSPGEGDGNPRQQFLLGKSHGQRNLEGYSPQGHKELDMTELPKHHHVLLYCWSRKQRQCSCLGHSTDGRPRWTMVHRIAQKWTRLSTWAHTQHAVIALLPTARRSGAAPGSPTHNSCRRPILAHCWAAVHCAYVPCLHPFLCQWASMLLQAPAIVNSAAVSIGVCVCVCVCVCRLGHSGMSDSCHPMGCLFLAF